MRGGRDERRERDMRYRREALKLSRASICFLNINISVHEKKIQFSLWSLCSLPDPMGYLSLALPSHGRLGVHGVSWLPDTPQCLTFVLLWRPEKGRKSLWDHRSRLGGGCAGPSQHRRRSSWWMGPGSLSCRNWHQPIISKGSLPIRCHFYASNITVTGKQSP